MWWSAHICCAKIRERAENLDGVAPDVREAKELEKAAGTTHPAPNAAGASAVGGLCLLKTIETYRKLLYI